MAKFKVVDQDSFEPDVGEVLDQEDIVDRDGYRDTKTMVEEMMDAGERLREYRREMYQYDKEEKNFEVEPTSTFGFDPIDAQRILDSEAERLRKLAETRAEEARLAAEAAAAAEAAKNAAGT